MSEFPKKLSQLQHLSKSSLEIFEQCPYRWASEYLFGLRDKTPNKFAAIGTASHQLMEAKLKGQSRDRSLLAKIPDKTERQNIVSFIDSLPPRKTIGIEHEFRVKFRDDAPPVLGYIDHFAWHPVETEAILIEDWKTNRQFESLSVWLTKLQPQIYPWAVRTIYPGTTIYYSVGYLILNKSVSWRTDPNQDQVVVERMSNDWDQIVELTGGVDRVPTLDSFPQRLGDHCTWCPVKRSCATFRNAVHHLSPESFKELVKSPAQRWLELKTIKSLLDDLIEEAEEELTKELLARAGEGKAEVKHGGKTISLSQSSTRRLSVSNLLSAVREAEEAGCPNVWEIVRERVDELLTVKIGEVDDLVSLVPELRKPVDSRLTRVASKPKLSVKD